MAFVAPRSNDDVSFVLAACTKASVPVHPMSGGANWGFGAQIPWSEQPAIVLDLRSMNKILHHDAEWGTIRVQPGVTFAAAYEHLGRRRSRFVMNPIGGSPHASVLANALERGHGVGPYGDRVGSLRRMQVATPRGMVDTDFEAAGGVGSAPMGRRPQSPGALQSK